MSLEWPPDEPIWIDVRSMLESGGARYGDRDHFVVCDPPPTHTVAVVGRPEADRLQEALAQADGPVEVLATEDNRDHVAAMLPGWKPEPVLMHVLAGDPPAIPVSPPARRVTVDDPLDHLPARMQREMERALGRTALFAAFEGGNAVSFAYAHRQTRTLADISIDTLREHRRRGAARAACAHLLRHLVDQGLRPTWGAYQSNEASKKLAEQLGFVPVGTIYGFTRPRT